MKAKTTQAARLMAAAAMPAEVDDKADASHTALVKAVRKLAFKEAADQLRTVAADVLLSRDKIVQASSDFIRDLSSFKMETRSIVERANALRSQADVIEAME
jgi:hypothetical protein